ncbi:hypothetical protein FD754_004863 [Muntiacus muntjak]|uniref:FYVE, RhoGEF and PH domain-containing protein 5 n=1 Tax=Muntiacus muntjak TaxID=9888 RepID=A0A5N3WI73_MUNMU|nr:hypothetical protein FD754_004863 [Muntiacus muntjak]
MSRGPKPPIAPKPRLATPSEWRASVYVINSLNKCSNGKLPCVDRGLYEERRSTPECSESEADEDYIVAPRSPPAEEGAKDAGCVENTVTGPPEAGEEGQERGEGCGPAGPTAAEAWAVLSGQADRDVAPAPKDAEGADCAGAAGTEDQTFTSEEEEEEGKLAEEHSACSLGDGGPGDGGAESPSDSIPAHLEVVEDAAADGEEEPGAPGTPEEADAEPERGVDEGDNAGGEPPEDEGSATGVPEAEVAIDDPDVSPEACEDAAGDGGQHGGQDEPAGPNENADPAEAEVGEDPREGEDPVQDEAAEDSCHIIPFESDSVDDLVPPLSARPYELFPTESTSFCSESYPPYSESAQEPGPGERAERDPEAGPGRERRGSAQGGAGEEGPPVPDVLVLPEDDDANPYEMGVGPPCGADPGQAETPGAQAASEELSPEAEGGLVPIDRKNVMARARPHSGKVAGYVPETVPEEMGPEAGSAAARKTVLSLEGKPLDVGRALPAKPRAFTLYPRSFSVEGREIPVSLYREPEACGLDGHGIKRKEDNLSLPCVIGSSGSFSQRSHLPSSGTSTPSSMVDIPPPFDLACITKKPITKSSPSLLVESELPDKQKKKKSSFKRFLALTFRKKSESKVHVDVSVSSSRSSSESSYHGPARLLEMDRRSLSNSPQLRARTGKLRACDSPSSLIFCREGKRKGVPFSRTVSRVESFEDRSRPPFLPLPLTKPRSISFPNADTSDYENIPAMNSDYENIQIPPRRPARAGTFTKLFEDQSRALSTANENDGYVDMSSFNAFESKPQSADPEAESLAVSYAPRMHLKGTAIQSPPLTHSGGVSRKADKVIALVVSSGPARLLSPWDFPGKTRVDFHFLRQGIFTDQGSNPRRLSVHVVACVHFPRHTRLWASQNPMDRGAWQATAHRVAKSWTRLRDLNALCPQLGEPIPGLLVSLGQNELMQPGIKLSCPLWLENATFTGALRPRAPKHLTCGSQAGTATTHEREGKQRDGLLWFLPAGVNPHHLSQISSLVVERSSSSLIPSPRAGLWWGCSSLAFQAGCRAEGMKTREAGSRRQCCGNKNTHHCENKASLHGFFGEMSAAGVLDQLSPGGRFGTARDQSLSLSCARFLPELVSSASSMPGAALAAAVVAASGRVSLTGRGWAGAFVKDLDFALMRRHWKEVLGSRIVSNPRIARQSRPLLLGAACSGAHEALLRVQEMPDAVSDPLAVEIVGGMMWLVSM